MSQHDLEVILFASTKSEKYLERFKGFCRYGLLNCKKYDVVVSVILDEMDDETKLIDLPKNFTVKRMKTKFWDQKITEYFTSDLLEDARWYIRIDDDSTTNVDMLIHDLDLSYDFNDPLYLTAERLLDIHTKYRDVLNQLGYGWWFNNWYENSGDKSPYDRNAHYNFAHEWEFAAFSNTAMKRIKNSPACIEFRNEIRAKLNCICLADHLTGILARLVKVNPIECHFVTSQCYLENYSYINGSGRFHHIHYVAKDLTNNGVNWDLFTKLVDGRGEIKNVETWEPTVYDKMPVKNRTAFVFPMVFQQVARFERCLKSVREIYGDKVDVIISNYDDRNCNRKSWDHSELRAYCAKNSFAFVRFDNEHFWCESVFQLQISNYLCREYENVFLVHNDIVIVRDFIDKYREKMVGSWSFICPYIGIKPYKENKDRYSGSLWGDCRLHQSIVIYNPQFLKTISERYTPLTFWKTYLSKSVAHSDLEHFDISYCCGYSGNPFDEKICLDLMDNWSYPGFASKSPDEIRSYVKNTDNVYFLHAVYTIEKYEAKP